MKPTPGITTSLAVAVLLAHARAQGPSPTWRFEPTITNRSHAAMVYHQARGAFVLFGGDESGGSGPGLDDTWLFQNGTWTRLDPSVSPPPRVGHAMAYDPIRQRILLQGGRNFGGRTQGRSDSWQLIDSNWQERSTSGGPGELADHAMAWDPQLQAIVLFGGWNPSTNVVNAMTWMWDDPSSTWIPLAPATSPSPRLGHRMVSDEVTGSILLFGGRADIYSANEFADTWRWQNGNWQLLQSATSPPEQSSHGLAFDSLRGRVVLFGALLETWEWNGTDWTRTALTGPTPEVESGHVMDYDRVNGEVILFGGGRRNSGIKRGGWRYDGTRWIELTNTPPVRTFPAIAYDSHRRRTVVFSGSFHLETNTLADTWEWDGHAWQRIDTPVHPPGRRYFNQMVYRTAGRHCVLWSEDAPWTWDGGSWTRRPSANAPPARDLTALAYDAGRDRVVLFGGRSTLAGGPMYGDTWEWDGTNWTQIPVANAPSARAWHGMTYDPVRRRVVLYGGALDTQNPYAGQTWEYDGTTWVRSTPSRAPRVSVGAAMCFHADRGRVVLYGGGPGVVPFGEPGYIGGISSDETWEWDGTDWTKVQQFWPHPRENAGLAYDVARQRAVMIGGQEVTPTSDNLSDPGVWSYYSGRYRFSPSVVRHGQPIDLTLTLAAGTFLPRGYAIGFAFARSPGIPLRWDPLHGALELPLTLDVLFLATLGGMQGSVPGGPLTLRGLVVPNERDLVGVTIYSAAIGFDATGVQEITNEIILTIN